MRCLIGIDDTDNLESRGTGFRARQLGATPGRGRARPGPRHHAAPALRALRRFPYTSHNSSACLDVDLDETRLDDARDFCREYLATESADGSDAGLCLAPFDAIADEMIEFGRSAKERDPDARAGPGARRAPRRPPRGRHRGPHGRHRRAGGRRPAARRPRRPVHLARRGPRAAPARSTAGTLLATTGIDSVESIDGRPLPPEADGARGSMAASRCCCTAGRCC